MFAIGKIASLLPPPTLLLGLWLVAFLAGCGRTGEAISFAGSVLGVVVDEHMQVVDLEPWGPALHAGVQVGDVLLAIAPLDENDPEYRQNRVDRMRGEWIGFYWGWHLPDPSGVLTETLQFAENPERIKDKISGDWGIIKLIVLRDGREQTIKVKPRSYYDPGFTYYSDPTPISPLASPLQSALARPVRPTPTPVWPPYDYF